MASNSTTSDFKLDRKSLKRPDSFLSSISGFFQELFKHNRLFLGLLGGVIILGSIGAFIYHRMENQTQEGLTELYFADKSLEAEIKGLIPPSVAQTPSESKKSKATDKASQKEDS